jgi:membrane-associated phospholipid phosphatase
MQQTTDRASLMHLFRSHALLMGLVSAYLATAYSMNYLHRVSVADEKAVGLFLAFLTNVPMMIFFILFYRLLQLTYVDRDPDRFARLKQDVMAFVLNRNRIKGGILAVLLMAGMLVAFAQMKNLIPVLNPFVWDEYFMHLDKVLHFGMHPFELTHAVFGWEYTVSFFTGLYNLWLFLMYFVLFGACFMRHDSPLRMQFLIAFVLTWAIGGNLIATVFSSAGPVYYANLGLGDAYAHLQNLLQSHSQIADLTVVNTQNLLWNWHTQEPQVNAISAFPSMHVASSVLMAIFLRHASRLLGLFAIFFAVGIMIGSVLLGWHYAVDGYAGAIIAAACWKLSGWMVRLTFRIQPATSPLVQPQP